MKQLIRSPKAASGDVGNGKVYRIDIYIEIAKYYRAIITNLLIGTMYGALWVCSNFHTLNSA